MFDREILDLSAAVLDAYRRHGRHLAIAESCTGGLIAAALTSVAGASDGVERGFVAYSNAAKSELLGVSPATIVAHGAVSAETAAAMAQGAVLRAPAEVAVSAVGVAGPDGGSAEKPVGLVLFGLARRDGECLTERHVFPGDRAAVRRAALVRALELLKGAAS